MNHTLCDDIIATHWQTLWPLLETTDIHEVLVNPDGHIWIDRHDRCQPTGQTLTAAQIMGSIHALRAMASHDTEGQHYLETHYRHIRISAAWPPLSPRGPCLCLRKKTTLVTRTSWPTAPQQPSPSHHHPQEEISLDNLCQQIQQDQRAALVIGPTSSGKTTLIRWLLQHCSEERLLIVEDTPELTLDDQFHWLSFITPANTWEALLPFALRCRPDRIIIGEVRGAEAWPLLNIYLSGHATGWTSLHAYDTQQALTRLTQLIYLHPAATALPPQHIATMIAETFGYIIQCQRIGRWRGPTRIDHISHYHPQKGYQCQRLYTCARSTT